MSSCRDSTMATFATSGRRASGARTGQTLMFCGLGSQGRPVQDAGQFLGSLRSHDQHSAVCEFQAHASIAACNVRLSFPAGTDPTMVELRIERNALNRLDLAKRNTACTPKPAQSDAEFPSAHLSDQLHCDETKIEYPKEYCPTD